MKNVCPKCGNIRVPTPTIRTYTRWVRMLPKIVRVLCYTCDRCGFKWEMEEV